MGIRASRWVTMHGWALNHQVDMRYFDYIVPCGIQGKAVTSMDRELGGSNPGRKEVRDELIRSFSEVFNLYLQMAKKFFKRALIGALLLSASLTLLLFLTDNAYIIKGVSHTYLRGKKSPGITDHALFDVRTVEATSPSALPLHGEYNQKEMTDRLSAELAKWNSVAFLVFLRDSLIHEQYWDGFSADSRTNTYSASKTVVTLAAQKAIEQGLIQGWDQKAKDYLPELKGAYADQLSLRHLSTMTAGLDWDEHYSSPFTITAKTYYTDRLEEVMLGVEIAEPPGKRHHYQVARHSFWRSALCAPRERAFRNMCLNLSGGHLGRKKMRSGTWITRTVQRSHTAV